PLDVKPEQVKARFFELSKSFHPDRYFRKNIGRYGDMLTMIFKKISEAYDVLYDPRKKKWYDRELAKPGPAAPAPAENAGRRSGPGKQAPAADATEQRIAAIKVKLDADMPDQALKEMDALKNVRDPRIPLLMANYYLKVGDPLSAKDYVQMAIEFDGNNVGAYELLGAIYMRFKLYRNALKVYETIMNIDSNNTDAVKMIEQIKPLIED
ncbi:MAG: DnaJ domain-containing protein, partial [Deltaproteobacteria bacterium]|nr:DnaJ domain-containing protein [Deltaproteobacteria bacterium]